MVFIDAVQTWYGPRQQRTHHDRSTFLQRQRYVHTTLYKTLLRLLNVRQCLNTSVVRLPQDLIASMSREAIQ